MKDLTRIKRFAIIFDPSWQSDAYRYEMQEVHEVEGHHDTQNLKEYSYSLCGKYYIWKPNCFIVSQIREVEIQGWEVMPTDELRLLDRIEDKVRDAAHTALQKTLDPILARKHELAMLTYQEEAQTHPELYEPNGQFQNDDTGE